MARTSSLEKPWTDDKPADTAGESEFQEAGTSFRIVRDGTLAQKNVVWFLAAACLRRADLSGS